MYAVQVAICIIYSMVGRSVRSQYIRPKVRSAEVNMPPRSDIEAMDLPTMLYMVYCMVSAQQTNLFA